MLFLALAAETADRYDVAFEFPDDDKEAACCRKTGEPRSVYVCPQHRIGRLHVDFLVTRTDFYGLVMGADGRETLVPRSTSVVVECDGHEFHEKTRDQARRLSRRDREVQMVGMPVLRYAGSEVWRAAAECAKEIIAFLEGRAQ
jgi:very-short-patch-repair endonuclease